MRRDDGLLGAFEEQVMLAVAHLGPDAYGMTIRRLIQERTGREVAIGAVYATLDRIERKGWVRSNLESGDEVRGGRARKLIRLCPPGANALRNARELRARMWDGVDASLLPADRP
jgi:DNA-binding PadR family transcriptional regulator